MSNGNSHAIQFAVVNLFKGRADFDAVKDVLIMDDPTYFLVGDIMKKAGVQVKLIRSDFKTGFDVEALEAYVESLSGKDFRVKGVYLIPIHQNPTSASMPVENQKKLRELAEKHDILVFADEPYPILNFVGGKSETSVMGACLNGDGQSVSKNVISMGSFSKIVCPGLRTGWIHAHPDTIDMLGKDPVLRSGGCFNPVICQFLKEMIDSKGLEKHIGVLNQEYSDRWGVMDASFKKHFKFGADADASSDVEISYESPKGGYFAWLKLPKITDTGAFRQFALDNKDKYGVGFIHGMRCTAQENVGGVIVDPEFKDKRFAQYFRVSWAFYEKEELAEGVRRLRTAYDDYLATGGK